MRLSRRTASIVALVACYVFTLWIIRLLTYMPFHSKSVDIVAGWVILALPIGSIWMIFVSYRHESNPWPYVLGALVPWVFVWYYISRVRARPHKDRKLITSFGDLPEPGKDIPSRNGEDRTPQAARIPFEKGTNKGARRLLSHAAWICFFCLTTGFAVGIVWGNWVPLSGWQTSIVAFFFMAHPFGALWMIIHSARNERNSLPFFFLAAVPYSFVWYYFERASQVQESR